MRNERIEELLRRRPPDEPDYQGELDLGPVAIDTVRAGPTRRAPRSGAAIRATTAAAAVIALAIWALATAGSAKPTPSPTPSAGLPTAGAPTAVVGLIPWIDATPAPSPTAVPSADPALLAACQASELALTARGWGGATGSLAGGMDLVNVSPNRCRLPASLATELVDATGREIATSDGAPAATGSGALVGVPGGGAVGSLLLWSNWCAAPPTQPLRVRLTIPGGAAPVSAEVRTDPVGGLNVPRCDAAGMPSSVGSAAFEGPTPSSGGYSVGPCAADGITAFTGAWGPALGSLYGTLVILNDGIVDCALDPTPTIELRDAHGGLLATTGQASAAPPSLTLPTAWTAEGMLFFADWCVATPAQPLAVDLLIGGARVPVTPVPPIGAAGQLSLPGCPSAPQTPPPTFGYNDPLAIPGNPSPSPPDPADSLPLAVHVAPLSTVGPGDVLDYAVTLTNRSPDGAPVDLAAACPSYTVRLFLPGASGARATTYLLNCPAAGTIDGGASATFAMRLDIPPDASAGTAAIVWGLGQSGPAAKVTFTINP